MITSIAQTALLIHDYDAAKSFYCDKLNFICIEDTQLALDKRWIRIAASGRGGSEILLVKASNDAEQALVGKQTAGRVLFFFHTNDFDVDYDLLRSRGIEFVDGPFSRPHGKVAVFKDLYGNRIDLIEPSKSLSKT